MKVEEKDSGTLSHIQVPLKLSIMTYEIKFAQGKLTAYLLTSECHHVAVDSRMVHL